MAPSRRSIALTTMGEINDGSAYCFLLPCSVFNLNKMGWNATSMACTSAGSDRKNSSVTCRSSEALISSKRGRIAMLVMSGSCQPPFPSSASASELRQ